MLSRQIAARPPEFARCDCPGESGAALSSKDLVYTLEQFAGFWRILPEFVWKHRRLLGTQGNRWSKTGRDRGFQGYESEFDDFQIRGDKGIYQQLS